MKLNETQINTIDNILEKSGVVYIDYKFEILDHIATEVEELMQETDENFENCLAVILKKWNPKLKKSSGSTFGYIWELPEILYQKAKKIYWKKMILLIILSLGLFPVLMILKNHMPSFFKYIQYILISALIFQFIGYFQIRISKQKTTFGFLYKQQFLAFSFMHLIPLYTLTTNDKITEKTSWDIFPFYFMITHLMLASIFIFKLYKQHFEQLKQNKSLI